MSSKSDVASPDKANLRGGCIPQPYQFEPSIQQIYERVANPSRSHTVARVMAPRAVLD